MPKFFNFNYLLKFFLKKIRLFVLKNQREKNLSAAIVDIIIKYKKTNNIKILDYGSGFEPKVAYLIKAGLNKSKIISRITCLDLYKKKDLDFLNKNSSLQFRNISYLSQKNNKYDFCIVADTLHHIGVENQIQISKILTKLKSKSKIIIIKDHFEYNFYSRQMLRFMDFIGNYYNNVNVPKKYFKQQVFDRLLKTLNLKIISKILNVKYYSNLFIFFSNPKLHFIYVIK
jgi:hypothetical protein